MIIDFKDRTIKILKGEVTMAKENEQPAVDAWEKFRKTIDWSRVWQALKGCGSDHFHQVSRIEDDSRTGILVVSITCDADVHIQTFPGNDYPGSIRFRTPAGGGRSARVRDALLLLAVAMAADNEESHQ